MEFKRFDIVRTKKNVALDDLYLKGGEEFTVVRHAENTICCIARGEDKMQYFRPEQQVKPCIDPKFLVNHGKLIASESITSAWGDTHNIFTYELNGEIWYYSYFIDKDGIKHIKSLSKIGEITE